MKSILQQGEGTFFDKFSEAFISGRLSPLIARFDRSFANSWEEAKLFGGVYPLEEMLIRLSDEERVTLSGTRFNGFRTSIAAARKSCSSSTTLTG